MNIQIYQIDTDIDYDGVCFRPYDELEDLQGTTDIDSSIYVKVFSGEVNCNSLDDVYQKFNIGQPTGYRGRSMSISDVIAVTDEYETKFYYCDTYEYIEIKFEPEESREAYITVVMCEPEKFAKVVEISTELKDLQEAVGGGYIETYYPFEDEEVCIVCNDEGKINGMPLNRSVKKDGKEYFKVYIGGGIGKNPTKAVEFDTLNVTDMKSMFAGCSSLQSIDLSKFDTSNVTDMRSMFSGCSSLTSLDLSTFDTSKVTNMGSMFYGCSSLTSIDLSSFDTSNVTNMNGMFTYCNSLMSLSTPHTYSTQEVGLPGTYRNVTNMQDTKKYKSFKQGDFTDSVHLTKYFYNITYNANNGIETAITQKNNLGQKISISNNTFTAPNGKKFKNWNTVKEGTGESYNPGDVYSKEGDINLYAQWEDITYTVTFKNGNTVAKTETVNQGASATAPNLTKTGYTLTWDKEFNNITSDLTVNAVWTPIAGVTYKVEHYKQKTSLDGYELADTENLTGTTDTQVIANAKTYPGFSENKKYNERVPSGTIAGDGSLVLKLYYDRNNYIVTLNANGGIINSGNITKYTYGIEAKLPTDVTKTGNTFAGWYSNQDFTGDVVTKIETTETGNKQYYAKWIKNEYTVTFKNGNTVAKTETVKYGEGATAPNLTKPGYTLTWDKEFNNITSDLTVNAVWTPIAGVTYKVEHYKQKTSLDGYELADTENLTGTADTQVTANAKTYIGFSENKNYNERVPSGTITGDGNLVLKLYYDRNNYTVTLNTNGGTVNSGNVTNYTYGIEETLPTDVTKTGEIFAGWYEKSDLTGKKVSSIANTETGNKEYYAKWTKNQYTVTFKDGDTVVKTETVNHGEGATAPTITKQGYTLSWDVDFRNITSDLTVKTVWTANDGEYKIEYYLEQEDGSYKKDETLTENLTGKIGEKVTAKGKTIEGYTEDTTNTNRVVNGEIAEDGSLVLKVYYKKEIIKETIKNEPIIQDTTTAKPESMPYAGISKTIITISILVIIIGIYYYTRYIKLRKYVK